MLPGDRDSKLDSVYVSRIGPDHVTDTDHKGNEQSSRHPARYANEVKRGQRLKVAMTLMNDPLVYGPKCFREEEL